MKERGRYESVEEYKAGTRTSLEANAKNRERNDRIDAAMKAITDNAECVVAEEIIKAEVERMYADFEHQMSHYGIKPEDYLKYNNSSPEQFRAERKEPAERNVKMRQVMRAIIKAENIDVTPEEVKAKLRDPNVLAELTHAAKHNGGSAEEYAYNDMLTDKFFEFILANNEFTLEKAEESAKETAATATEKPAAKKPATAKSASGTTAAKKPAAKKSTSGTATSKKPAAKKATENKAE